MEGVVHEITYADLREHHKEQTEQGFMAKAIAMSFLLNRVGITLL